MLRRPVGAPRSPEGRQRSRVERTQFANGSFRGIRRHALSDECALFEEWHMDVKCRSAVMRSAVFVPNCRLRFELDYELSAEEVLSSAVVPFSSTPC